MSSFCYRIFAASQLLVAGDPELLYHVREFKDSPGIFYEEIGKLNLCTDVWVVAVPLDMLHLAEVETTARRYLEQFKSLCNIRRDPEDPCKELNEHLDRLDAALVQELRLVHDLVGGDMGRRRRRGLIDGLGSVVKAITGNLDAADGERIDAELVSLHQEYGTLKKGIKQQLQVVETTLSMFNQTSQVAQRNMEAMRDAVVTLRGKFKDETNFLHQRTDYLAALDLLESTFGEVLEKVREAAELLAEVTTGKVGPIVVTPEKLAGYLTEALAHLPRGHSFSRPVTPENAPYLLQQATARAYRKGACVMLLLEFPLIGRSEYTVNRVYPLPTRGDNGTFFYLETSEEFVVVDRESRSYLKVTRQDLAGCKRDGNRYLCTPQHPVLAINDDAPCGVQVYASRGTDPAGHCPKRVIRPTRTFVMKLEKMGRWLYVAPRDESIDIQCDGSAARQGMLRGTGAIELDGKCTATTQDFRVETARRYLQEVKDGSYLPNFNLTLNLNETKTLERSPDLGQDLVLESVIADPRELNRLGAGLRDLREQLDAEPAPGNLSWRAAIEKHGTSLVSIALTVGILLVVGIRWGLKRRRRNTDSNGRGLVEVQVIPRARLPMGKNVHEIIADN